MVQVIEVVVGAQFGSEAKGHVTAQLIQKALHSEGHENRDIINVRVAGPNAGHTVYDAAGVKFAFRQVPVGAVVDDSVVCYIAPGSEVDVDVLVAEVDFLHRHGHFPQIFVSSSATLLSEEHKAEEQGNGLVSRIGSTGKGIGAARAARVMRTALRVSDDPNVVEQLRKRGIHFREPAELYSDDVFATGDREQHVVVEGTQGYGLGVHTEFYPQTTSSDCRAVDFLAMAGISPWRAGSSVMVWVVARPYPIRVAGNSGPLKDETSWDALGLEPEFTTVTKKMRRVGGWDGHLVAAAVQANGGRGNTRIAFTMADQVIPELAGATTVNPAEEHQLQSWVDLIESETKTTVGLVTTSATTCVWL